CFVASGEGNRLERAEGNDLRIVEGKLDDAPDLLVVDAVHDGGDGHDVHAVGVKVFDGAQLDVEQVADFAVRVGGVANAVKLQINVTQSGFGGLLAELGALGKLDAISRGLHAGVAHLARVADRVEEVRRER